MLIEELLTLKTMMVGRIIYNIIVSKLVDIFAGAYFLPRYIYVYEDTGGDVELCIQYPSRDDLPQTFNASVSAIYRYYDGKS